MCRGGGTKKYSFERMLTADLAFSLHVRTHPHTHRHIREHSQKLTRALLVKLAIRKTPEEQQLWESPVSTIESLINSSEAKLTSHSRQRWCKDLVELTTPAQTI